MIPTYREFGIGSTAYKESLVLREAVLRRPIGLSLEGKDFEYADNSLHIGAFVESILIGSLILEPFSRTAVKMRQVAISNAYQGKKIGSSLVEYSEKIASRLGFKMMFANAREESIAFYCKLGYKRSGKQFFEVGLPHCLIYKMI